MGCFLHIAHLNTEHHHSCRLDQQALYQLISECIAQRPSSTQREVVTPTQRASLTNVSITFRYPTQMLNLPSDTPIKFITFKHLPIKRCSHISQTVHCFQQLKEFAVNGQVHGSCKR